MRNFIYYFFVSFFFTLFQFFRDPAPLFFGLIRFDNFFLTYPYFFRIDINRYTARFFYTLVVFCLFFCCFFLVSVFFIGSVQIFFVSEAQKGFYIFYTFLFYWVFTLIFWFLDIRKSSFRFFNSQIGLSDFRDFSFFLFSITGDAFDFFVFIFFFFFSFVLVFSNFSLKQTFFRWFVRIACVLGFFYFFGGENVFIDFFMLIYLYFFCEIRIFASIFCEILFRTKFLLFFLRDKITV